MKKKFKINRSTQKGLTLVELLVYFGLFSILLVVINSLFIATLQQQTQDTARSALQQESEYIIAKLRHEIYNADSIVVPANQGESSQSLSLESNGVTRTYGLSNQQLVMTSSGETQVVTSGRIRATDFQAESLFSDSATQSIRFELEIVSDLEEVTNSDARTIIMTVTRR